MESTSQPHLVLPVSARTPLIQEAKRRRCRASFYRTLDLSFLRHLLPRGFVRSTTVLETISVLGSFHNPLRRDLHTPFPEVRRRWRSYCLQHCAESVIVLHRVRSVLAVRQCYDDRAFLQPTTRCLSRPWSSSGRSSTGIVVVVTVALSFVPGFRSWTVKSRPSMVNFLLSGTWNSRIFPLRHSNDEVVALHIRYRAVQIAP